MEFSTGHGVSTKIAPEATKPRGRHPRRDDLDAVQTPVVTDSPTTTDADTPTPGPAPVPASSAKPGSSKSHRRGSDKPSRELSHGKNVMHRG